MNREVSDGYRLKLKDIAEEMLDRVAVLRGEDEVGLRVAHRYIESNLGIRGLSHTKLDKWRRQVIRWTPEEPAIEAIAAFFGCSVRSLNLWLNDDDAVWDDAPWNNEAEDDGEYLPPELRLTYLVQQAPPDQLASVVPRILERLFGNNATVLILPKAEIGSEGIRQITDFDRLLLADDSDQFTGVVPMSNTHPGDGKVAAYVEQLLKEEGRDLEESITPILVLARMTIGDFEKQESGAETIRKVLEGTQPRFVGDEEDLLVALAAGLTMLLATEVSADHLLLLNSGENCRSHTPQSNGAVA
jgi:hypothetical protein